MWHKIKKTDRQARRTRKEMKNSGKKGKGNVSGSKGRRKNWYDRSENDMLMEE